MFGITPAVIPGTTPSDTAGAFAVLAVLGNDSAYKQRLDELVAQVTAANQAADRAAADAKKATAAQAAAEQALAALAPREAAVAAKANELQQATSAYQAGVAQREAALQASTKQAAADNQASIDAAYKEINERKASQDQRNLDLADAERVNEQREASRQQWMEQAVKDLNARQQAVAEAEDKNKAETATLKTMRVDLEKRLGQLRQLIT